ncbi:MAG TPA: hypothetical protein VEP90_30845 [Methylomirabilota bacterium]|nr:hypothetical protein [Methylomirabilota bacterium]
MNTKSKDQKTTLEGKTKHWDNIRQQIDQVAKRGFRADPELGELITGLSMLGTQPRISVFGEVRDNSKHATKRRVIAPRVWIEPEVDKKIEEKYKELRQNYSRVFEKSEKEGIAATQETDEEFIKARDELDEFNENLSLPHNVLTIKLFDLLTEFYQGRQAPYGAQISLSGFFERVMLENSGNHSLCIFTNAEQERKLKEYQDEFIAFGKFLKSKYFSE